MNRLSTAIAVLMLLSVNSMAQQEEEFEKIPIIFKKQVQREWYIDDSIEVYIFPEFPVYKDRVPRFRTSRERRQYDRLVYNVKKVLPIAKEARSMLIETYEMLQSIPDTKERERHMKAVERSIKQQYTPKMKKLTYSQGKLLIKLIDRECNQTSYEVIKAFLGVGRATFYQVFAWTFRASLKKQYEPDGEDAMVERVVRQVELGLL